MIKTSKYKGLKQLFETGSTTRINAQHVDKCLRLMDALDASLFPEDMKIPGFGFHGLIGKPKRYAVSVNGNWRITFGWEGQDAIKLDLEDYH
ncbi:MAG: proteic killer suppression protein [Gammaproteobacteria bacterium]|jgi:proteic killer suppression protein